MIIDPIISDSIKKTDIEQVQKHKQEYTFLGSYRIKKGMSLFSYNMQTRTIEMVVLRKSNTIHVEGIGGVLVAVDKEMQKAIVDTRKIYFQALNANNANNRVNKWKQGKIKDLFNLDKPANESIKFY